MKNLAFVLWMLFWPVLSELTSLIVAKTESIRGIQPKSYSDVTEGWVTLFGLMIWILVGLAIYER